MKNPTKNLVKHNKKITELKKEILVLKLVKEDIKKEKLTKKQRERAELKKMFGGKCAYCGCELEKIWHADHVKPVVRISEVKPESQWKHRGMMELRNTGELRHPERDDKNNLYPSCPGCNMFKGVYNLEAFRENITYQIEQLRRDSSGFRILERFGLVNCFDGLPVIFWFEQYDTGRST